MSDVFDSKERSRIMRLVKSSRNKSTELKLIKYFRSNHITGWKRNYKLTGHPDFVFPKQKIAIFTDGCFWHGHDCRNLKPDDNSSYWLDKITKNKNRDILTNEILSKKNWIVIRLWECELTSNEIINKKLSILDCKHIS